MDIRKMYACSQVQRSKNDHAGARRTPLPFSEPKTSRAVWFG